MKKILILCMAAMMTATVMAETSIPQSIYGIHLGKSTPKEVDKILTAQGLEFSKEMSDSTNYVYVGDCKHEDMEFDYMLTRYMGDTLIFVGFRGKCNTACTDYGKSFIERIHSKYDHLQIADSALYYKMLTVAADNDNLDKWGRKDDNTIVTTMSNDSTCICIYFAESYMDSYVSNAILEVMKAGDPDYAEENRVTGVAGVKFGDSRYAVEESLTRRFGKSPHYDVNEIKYNNVMIGGSKWDYAIFYFKQNPNNRKHELISVSLQQIYKTYEKDEAEMAFDNVRSQYSGKYTNGYCPPKDDGSKICFYGMKTDDYPYPPISLTMDKSLSVGGEMFYYVTVDYYVVKLQGRYNDDI